MLRRILVLLLCSCLIFSFAACGTVVPGTDSPSHPSGTESITVDSSLDTDLEHNTDSVSSGGGSSDLVSTDSAVADTSGAGTTDTDTDSEESEVIPDGPTYGGDAMPEDSSDDSDETYDDPTYEEGIGTTVEDPPSVGDAPGISDTTDTPSSTEDAPGTSTDTSSPPPAAPEKTVQDVLSSAQHYVGLCDQINGRIIVCDLAVEDWSNDNAVVWEFRHDTSGGENLGWIAGIKFRYSDYYGGDVLLFCAPRSKAYIVSMKTKKILLTASSAGVNPHSVELLPNGTLIVGSSNDGLVSIYPPGKTTPSYTLTLAGNDAGTKDVHGVLWDPKYDVLWVSGGQKLRSFKVTGPTAKPTLTMTAEYNTPAAGLHDLAPVYGNTEKLILRGASGAVAFHKDTKQFSYSYPGAPVGRTFSYIPGCGNFTTGVFACTAITSQTKVYQSWDTNIVQVYVPLDNGKYEHVTRKAPNDAYYKLRVYNFNYQ